MRVVWVGTNDGEKHCRHHHALRLHMRDHYGVTLIGPGHTWDAGRKRVPLPDVARKADVLVVDLRGSGPVSLDLGEKIDCFRVMVERDYHNKPQWPFVLKYDPHLILGSVLRPSPPDGLDPWTQRHTHVPYDPWIDDPRWTLWNYPVDMSVFYPKGERTKNIALFGVRTVSYLDRRAARRALRGRKDTWMPRPTLIRAHKKINTALHYHDKLADGLRMSKMLWVDGSNYNIFLGKYNEGIASGCLLIGRRPFGWDRYYPNEFIQECSPDTVNEVVDKWATKDKEREEITRAALDYCRNHHSIEKRGAQVWDMIVTQLATC